MKNPQVTLSEKDPKSAVIVKDNRPVQIKLKVTPDNPANLVKILRIESGGLRDGHVIRNNPEIIPSKYSSFQLEFIGNGSVIATIEEQRN